MSDDPVDRAPRRGGQSQFDVVRAGIVVVCFVVALILLLGPAGNLTAGAPTTTIRKGHHHVQKVAKNKTTVVVANSAGVNGAAASMSSTLSTLGWDVLTATTALGGIHQHTIVFFARGEQQAAKEVASEIGVNHKRVTLRTAEIERIVPGAKNDDVVVLLGKDLAH
jgi:hypothetical protein